MGFLELPAAWTRSAEVKLPAAEFQRLAERAFANIPKSFRKRIVNVHVEVRGRPGREAGRWRGSRALLGLYAGPTRWELSRLETAPVLPARILLYRENLLSVCATRKELLEEIRATLRHELGHHFGFEDADLE